MNHSEIVKEADRISKNEHEAWNCVYWYLTNKEISKLNHSKVYECQDTLSWYIKTNAGSNFAVYPFGFFFADYLNQLNSLKSKEAFIAYEKRMRTDAYSEKEVNPTFDKISRFFVWNYDERTRYDTKYANSGIISDKELENIYYNCCWLWEYIEKDVNYIIKYLNYQKSNTVPAHDILNVYLYVRRMILMIWHRQINSSIYNKNSEGYYAYEEDSEEVISYKFVEESTVSQLRYIGYETLTLDDEKEVFCKKYDIPNLLFLVAEDLMRFMLHQTTHTFSFCPECGCMFVTTHGNQKHCPACNLIIRQKKRKQNKARYLHKKITDYINNYRSGEGENASEIFRNESNYYWDIVQGKNPEKVKEYSAKIKTEADYMKWLEKKYEEIKAKK